MQCSRCWFDNPAGMKFCGECGTLLQLLCAQCGFENPPPFKFCGACGAAVIGGQFSYALLQAVSPMHEAMLQGELVRLVQMEFLYQRGLPPQATYTFKHTLIRDAAYQSLLKSTRQQYHERIARVLTEQFPETAGAQPELLAHHYTEAGLLAQAIVYWQQAGEHAIHRSANVEAIGHLTTALELLRTLSDSSERSHQELLLQTTLGPALIAVKGYAAPEVGQTYTRAYDLCRHLEETAQIVPTLVGLWLFYLLKVELHRARELGDRLLSLAQRTQDPVIFLSAHYALGNTLAFLGELSAAREHLEQGIALYDPHTHGSLAYVYGEDPGVACSIFRAWCLWYLGYPDQAGQCMHETVTLARGLSHPYSLAFALCASAILHHLCQESHATQVQAEAAMALCREQGFPFYLTQGLIMRGWALAEQGQTDEGIAQMRQGLTAYQTTGTRWVQPYFLALLAEAYAKAGQVHEGLHMLSEAFEVIASTRECVWEAELYRLRGELMLHSGAQGHASDVMLLDSRRQRVDSEAEAGFHRALGIARGQHAKSWELRAAMSLSRLWQQQGRPVEAGELLVEVYSWCTEGFVTAELQQAQALLNELGA